MVKKDGQTPVMVWRFPRISLASRVDGVRALKPESQKLSSNTGCKNLTRMEFGIRTLHFHNTVLKKSLKNHAYLVGVSGGPMVQIA